MREIDREVVRIRTSEKETEQFIHRHERYLIRLASKTTGRFITKSDDEWSIVLIAFSECIASYAIEKGAFYPYANLVVKNRLIDYFRSQGKFSPEMPTDVLPEMPSPPNSRTVKEEIEAVSQTLNAYGFDFMGLAKVSPKARKTKNSCRKAVQYLLKTPLLIKEMEASHQLPLAVIEKNTQVPRKIIERHRRYIIAATVILSGDFPYLSEYLNDYRKEGVL